MSGKRLHWIDVAKGLLAIMVVYSHIRGQASSLGYNDSAIDGIDLFSNLFVPFFMPCFFVITGFCSNFEKSFKSFVFASIKGLIIPAFVFSFFFSGAYKVSNITLFKDFIKSFLYFGGNYWFLSAMFIARLSYWTIKRITHNSVFISILCCLSFILGFLLRQLPRDFEYWWFVHALLMIPYLRLGDCFRHISTEKEISRSIPYTVLCYILVLSLTILLTKTGLLKIDSYYYVPGITQRLFNINLSMLLPLVALSTIGSFTILGMSKSISSNSFLEYLGQNSLVVYCIQGYVLNKTLSLSISISHMVGINYQSFAVSLLLIILSFIASLVVCTIVSWVINLKYIRILIGKF